MFTFRQILRCGARLALTREPINLHQNTLIRKEKLIDNLRERIFVRTNTNLCESPKESEEDTNKKVLCKIEQKMKVMFTCKRCRYRTSKIVSKIAYERGVIIIRCAGCKNNHLIADNLGWFEELKNKKNIEVLLAAKGETIRKVQNDVEGYIEAVEKAEFELQQHNKEWELRQIEEQSKIKCKKSTGSSEET